MSQVDSAADALRGRRRVVNNRLLYTELNVFVILRASHVTRDHMPRGKMKVSGKRLNTEARLGHQYTPDRCAVETCAKT